MIDERTLVTIIMNTTQDECREIGELFLSFADNPRDAAWKARWRARLEQLPVPTVFQQLEEARLRSRERNDELFATGWHPDQMRKKLEELGYTGNAPHPDQYHPIDE